MREKVCGKVIISEDLLKVKDMIGRPSRIKVRDSREEVLTQLKEMGYRIDVMERGKKEGEMSIAPKRKKQILFILKDRKMTSPEVGKALGLSRSRSNEYLKFMEEEGLLVGEKKGRKKLYALKESCE